MFRIVHPKDLRRTQNTVPRATLRYALGYPIMPLLGRGSMVHRRELQPGHRPILRAESERVAAPFYGRRANESDLTEAKEPVPKLRRKEGLGKVAKAGLEPATHGL